MRLLLAIMCLLVADPSHAQLPEQVKDKSLVMGKLLEVGSAINTANVCGFGFDDDAYAALLRELLGENTKLDIKLVASIQGILVYAGGRQKSIVIDHLNKSQRAVFCNNALKDFGPEGSKIRGLIKR